MHTYYVANIFLLFGKSRAGRRVRSVKKGRWRRWVFRSVGGRFVPPFFFPWRPVGCLPSPPPPPKKQICRTCKQMCGKREGRGKALPSSQYLAHVKSPGPYLFGQGKQARLAVVINAWRHLLLDPQSRKLLLFLLLCRKLRANFKHLGGIIFGQTSFRCGIRRKVGPKHTFSFPTFPFCLK